MTPEGFSHDHYPQGRPIQGKQNGNVRHTTVIPSIMPPSPACACCVIPGAKQLHSALSNLAMFSMLAGTYAIYSNKENFEKPHWTTWHAWAGLLALALWLVNQGIAVGNTADLQKGRMWFMWTSRNHRCMCECMRVIRCECRGGRGGGRGGGYTFTRAFFYITLVHRLQIRKILLISLFCSRF